MTLVVLAMSADGARAARPPAVGPAMAVADLTLRHHATAARPEPSRYWRAPRSLAALVLDAVELDDELDDEPLAAVDDETTAARARCEPHPAASRPPRAERARDTSRFAAGTGLPRGPPV